MAKDLGIDKGTLRLWVIKAQEKNPDKYLPESQQLMLEIRHLKKELAQVKMEREILKKATAFFAKTK